MLRPRIALPVVLLVAVVAVAGVAAATRHAQSTQAAAADFTASTRVAKPYGNVCRERRHLPAHDRDVHRQFDVERCPVERARRAARVQRREHDDEARLPRRDSACPRPTASGNVHAAIANGAAVGSLVGQGSSAGGEARRVDLCCVHAGDRLRGGQARLGQRERRRRLLQPRRLPEAQAAAVDGRVPSAADAGRGRATRAGVWMRAATGNLTLDLTRDASGNVTGGNVVFYVNYRFPGSITLTGLALHQGVRGANGPVVLDAGIGTFTDTDGRGNITKVVSSASASLLQALLATPRGYYVDVSTSTNAGGALRDQLGSPEQR